VAKYEKEGPESGGGGHDKICHKSHLVATELTWSDQSRKSNKNKTQEKEKQEIKEETIKTIENDNGGMSFVGDIWTCHLSV